MNILVVQRNAQIGGGNTYLLAVAPELRRRGHSVSLFVGPGPVLGRLRDAVDHLVPFRIPIHALNARALRRMAIERDIDVINAHTVTTGQLVLRAVDGLGIPLVQHAHSLIPLDTGAAVLGAAAQVIVMNQSVADHVASVPGVGDKTIISRLAVDEARYRATPIAPHEGFRVLYCGRLSRRKAAHVEGIMQMLETLDSQIPGITLTVVGGRSHKRHVAALGNSINRKLGRKAVSLAGQTLEPSQYLAQTDLVVGTGYVVLEAMATGRHVVGVGIQGLTGLLTPGNLEASIAANFGDHDAFERDVTPEKLAAQIIDGYRAWTETPSPEWGPATIAREFSVSRISDDLERAFAAAMRRS